MAEHKGRAIGAGLAVGDGAGFWYLKDIMVRLSDQWRGVGSSIVSALMEDIRSEGLERALVGLFTGRNLAGFYERFGFAGQDDGLHGMTQRL